MNGPSRQGGSCSFAASNPEIVLNGSGHSSHMSIKQVVEQGSNSVERPVKADLCPEFEGDRIDMWTDIRFGALHGSSSPALFGIAVPCGNGLPRCAGFPHQAVIQPRIKAGFVVGIGPG